MSAGGARTWYFPDGYLPAKQKGADLEAHESLMLLNVGTVAAHARIDIYFSDRDPIRGIAVDVPAERIIALRMDAPSDLGGAVIPALTQYAIRVTSDENLVLQFGRLDTTQANLSYYGSDGFYE
jgi:hypothetical protein